MSGLDEYRRRRRPGRTPEPAGETRGSDPTVSPIFVVQKHAARRLHYDLRLERGGALASWAVPRGIPLRPGSQALAVRVEDHPLEYADFAGEIPRGEYGAGTVEIWDRGRYELIEEKADGGLTVRLHGARLEGTWTLVPAALDGEQRNWLLVRKRDRYSPMLAAATTAVPGGRDWLFEVKWDGYRALARVERGRATLWSRNGTDLAPRFPQVAAELPHALRADCVVDGELCALDAEGRSRFQLLQQQAAAVVLYLFDLLELDGEPLLERPLRERRQKLEQLLGPGSRLIRLSRAFTDGEALLEAARERELEGIIAKRAGSRYRPGRRSRDWLKLKSVRLEQFTIVGYTPGSGSRAELGALVLAEPAEGGLRWVGNVGSGFDQAEVGRLLERLGRLRTATPAVELPRRATRAPVAWVQPRLRCRVSYH